MSACEITPSSSSSVLLPCFLPSGLTSGRVAIPSWNAMAAFQGWPPSGLHTCNHCLFVFSFPWDTPALSLGDCFLLCPTVLLGPQPPSAPHIPTVSPQLLQHLWVSVPTAPRFAGGVTAGAPQLEPPLYRAPAVLGAGQGALE